METIEREVFWLEFTENAFICNKKTTFSMPLFEAWLM